MRKRQKNCLPIKSQAASCQWFKCASAGGGGGANFLTIRPKLRITNFGGPPKNVIVALMLGFWMVTDVFSNLKSWGSTYSNLVFGSYWVTVKNNPVLFISTSVWVLRTPNSGRNMLFQHLIVQKAEKRRKSKTIDLNRYYSMILSRCYYKTSNFLTFSYFFQLFAQKNNERT